MGSRLRHGQRAHGSWLMLLGCVLAGCAVWLCAARLSRGTAGVHAASEVPATLATPDAACARCHAEIYARYEQTAMARTSGLATANPHTGTWKHDTSGVTYTVSERESSLWLRSERGGSSRPLDDTEKLVLYVGSGKHGFTYLFSRAVAPGDGSGERLWYEAPINWYTRRAQYGMAPAFDNVTSAPLALPTDPGCLHCHATGVAQAQPEAVNAFAGLPFAQGGVGCAACHGDAAAHVASGGKAPMLKLAALPFAARESVCLQCHLEGDAMVEEPGRHLAQFMPGEDLRKWAVYFVDASSERSERRASSQYEALLRSACRRGAGEALTCTTCHDPHSTPAAAERVAFYRGKCLGCHTAATGFNVATHHPQQPDCASCHMPSRPTSDISHEQAVDHDIEARPRTTGLADAVHATGASLVPVGHVSASERDLGLAYAQMAERGDRTSYERALPLLARAATTATTDPLVHEQLGYLLQIGGHAGQAREQYQTVLAVQPHNAAVLANLAVLEAQAGAVSNAEAHLSTVAMGAPDQTAALLDLAMLQCRVGQTAEALKTANAAQHFNPDSDAARTLLLDGEYAGLHCRVQGR